MSDGFPELPNPAGEPLGYERARARFAAAASVAAVRRATGRAPARSWRRSNAPPPTGRGRPRAAAPAPSDDVTFLVLRAT